MLGTMRSFQLGEAGGWPTGCECVRTGDGAIWAVVRAPTGMVGGVDLALRVGRGDDDAGIAEGNPDIDWAWRWLAECAELASRHPGWFDHLTVIPNGDPPEPLAEHSPYHAWMLVRVADADDAPEPTEMVPVLEMVPITGAEFVAQRTLGAAGLFDLLVSSQVWGRPIRAWRADSLPARPVADGDSAAFASAATAIATTRQAVVAHQGHMGSLELLRGRIHPPAWLTTEDEDPLHLVFADQWILRRHGWVVWGHIAEANDLLRLATGDDHPATVVWSLDPWFDHAVDDLRRIAGDLRDPELGRRSEGETARFARRLSEHVGRVMQWPVPASLAGGRQVILTSILVHRPHLPDGQLASPVVPLLIAPGRSQAAMILPVAEWSPELCDLWAALAR